MPFQFKVVVPKPLKLDNVGDKVAEAFRVYVPHIIDDFNKTTVGWEHKVEFRYRIRQERSKNVSMKIWTDDEIWNYVNGGTKGPYEIWAGYYTGKSDKKALTIFESKPATMPGMLASNPSKRGPLKALRTHVTHPGIKARRFDMAVNILHARPLTDIVRKAIIQAVRESGHVVRG